MRNPLSRLPETITPPAPDEPSYVPWRATSDAAPEINRDGVAIDPEIRRESVRAQVELMKQANERKAAAKVQDPRRLGA